MHHACHKPQTIRLPSLNNSPPAQSVDLHLLAPGARDGPSLMGEPTSSAVALGPANRLLSRHSQTLGDEQSLGFSGMLDTID